MSEYKLSIKCSNNCSNRRSHILTVVIILLDPLHWSKFQIIKVLREKMIPGRVGDAVEGERIEQDAGHLRRACPQVSYNACHQFHLLWQACSSMSLLTKILSRFTFHYFPCHICICQIKPSDRRLPLPSWGECVRNRLYEVQDPRHHLLYHPLRDCKARQLRGGWWWGGRWRGCWSQCRKIC